MPRGMGVRLPLPAPSKNGISSLFMPFYIIKTKQNKMDVSVKNRDALNAVLTVKISNEDYASPYEKSLNN